MKLCPNCRCVCTVKVCVNQYGFIECALGSAGSSWQVLTGLRLSQVCAFRSSDSPEEPWNETLVSFSLLYNLSDLLQTKSNKKTECSFTQHHLHNIISSLFTPRAFRRGVCARVCVCVEELMFRKMSLSLAGCGLSQVILWVRADPAIKSKIP